MKYRTSVLGGPPSQSAFERTDESRGVERVAELIHAVP